MPMKKISCFMIAFVLMLTGCTSTTNTNQAEALNAGEYSAILPYESSDSRIKHASLISDSEARYRMEGGVMELSKVHFSPSQVAYKTQEFLDYDELDATDGSRGLLGTNRDDNPNGLNPGSDEEFNTGNGNVTGAIILVDLYELDWYADDELQGISIGMIVNDAVTDSEGKLVEITKERMENYFEVTSGHLVSYMRERFNEITSNVPIYIACYQLDSSGDSLGGFIYQGYFEGSQSNFSELDWVWMDVPSTTFTSSQETIANQFSEFQSSVSSVLTDYSYAVGQASIFNDKVNELLITVTVHGKSASEVIALIQACRDGLSSFSDEECEYCIEVIMENKTYALLERDSGGTQVDILYLYG